MPKIQHYSRTDIREGLHPLPVTNTILIQIKEVDEEDFVVPAFSDDFERIRRFEFNDVSSPVDPWGIQDNQAEHIADILRVAYANGSDVMVHCQAGISRSSAVAVCGQMIGFELEDKVRQPNALVKDKIMKALGIKIDETTSVFATHNDDWWEGDI